MSKLFIGRVVGLMLALLIASSMSHTHGQIGGLTDEDEADILESLIQNEIKPFGSEFGTPRTFSTENISSVSASRIKKLGFWLLSASDIQSRKRSYLIDYVVISRIYLKDGVVIVRLSEVKEGRPCFAPAFSTERSLTYEFQKSANGWVGRLVKRPTPFTFSRSLAFPP